MVDTFPFVIILGFGFVLGYLVYKYKKGWLWILLSLLNGFFTE